ncbi:MAG: IclR family transcriptional regulator [Egibacteraceae bacterium]
MAKAILVLREVAHTPEGLGPRELARRLSIPRSTAQRLLSTLNAANAVTQESDTLLYRLGPAVLGMASSYLDSLDVRRQALPHMRELQELSNETVGLSVRIGQERAYVELLESQLELKAKPVTGRPYPLYSGAPGHALLAFLPDEEIQRLLDATPFTHYTDNTPVTREQVWEAVHAVRKDGVALAFEETILGLNTVAAPVRSYRQSGAAAISISGPVSRFRRSEMERLTPKLARAATAISSSLGALEGPPARQHPA